MICLGLLDLRLDGSWFNASSIAKQWLSLCFDTDTLSSASSAFSPSFNETHSIFVSVYTSFCGKARSGSGILSSSWSSNVGNPVPASS